MDAKSMEKVRNPEVAEKIRIAAKEAARRAQQIERRLRMRPEDMTRRVSI
ncbi:hypothetical protein LLH23_09550 [bacterium]|nr:hypothetical protein [bacterium]